MKKLKTQILLWMVIIVVPLLVILIAYNVYTLKILNNQVALNNKNMLSIYEKPIAKDIDYISYLLANLLANDVDMQQLNYADSYLDAYVCCNNIAADYRAVVNGNLEGLGILGISSPRHGITRMVYADSGHYTYHEKCELEKIISDQIQKEESYKNGWQLIQATDRNYLLRILRNNETYAIIVLEFSLFSTPQSEKEEVADGYMIYASEDYEPLTMQEFIEKNEIVLRDFDGNYYIADGKENNYMVVEKNFPYAGVRQFYISSYIGIFQYLDYIQILFIAMTLVIACIVPIGFYYMKRKLFNPLGSLTETMKLIGNGQAGMRMDEEYDIEEFIQMKNTFNIMLDKIEELKIDAYEREIQLKNVQMQYLQIQIRPHFFLNCLKNIYALAAQKEYGKIQEMIIVLSQYFRSMFKSDPSFIPLREEIEGAKNYILLQNMFQSKPLECGIDIAPGLLDIPIPPLSIITFLENSVKHGRQSDRGLMISIKGSELVEEKESFMCITILDNGPGFPQEILDSSKNWQEEGDEAHIGILNVKKRIDLLYQGKAMVLFSNSNGACVELYIPIGGETNDNLNRR